MSLFIEDLTLSHFRSHRAARLELDGRPVAIWGANGAGKTNILEAVSLLSPGRGLRRAAMDDIARKPESLGWKVRAELQSLHQTHDIETWSENGASRTVKIDGKSAAQIALGRIARVVWLIPAMDRLWIEAPEGRRRFLDRMVMSFEPRHADAVLSYEKAMRERNRLLKDMVRDAHWYAALEAQMATSGAAIMQNRLMVLGRLKGRANGVSCGLSDVEGFRSVRPARARDRSARCLQRQPPPRSVGGAHINRPTSCRFGGGVCRQERLCGSMFHRRTKGAADFAHSRQWACLGTRFRRGPYIFAR